MREPSIHITKSQFEDILSQLEVYNFPTEAFFVIARKEAVNTRAVLVSNNKNTKQVNNILLASKGDAALVADIIYATRIKLKHRGVRKIRETDPRNWTACKKIAEICNQFCEDFQLDTREGFIKYIEIGIQRMSGNYNNLLNRLPVMYENITSYYESQGIIEDLSRTDREVLEELQREFVKRVADATGIYEEFKDNPEKMTHLWRMYDLCRKKQWNPKTFIYAQFESLAWCNGLPEVQNMYSEKAIERYTKYIYKINSKKINSESTTPTVEGSLWDKIK